ncbi:MAG TPA: hypothetical protein VGE52_16785, partial [Pirellulales bacterium]
MFFAALIAESDGVLVIAKQPVGASALAAAKKKTPKGVVVLGRLRWDKDAEKFKFGCRGDGSVKAGLKQILKAALQGSAPKFELEDPKLAATEPAEEDDDAPGVDAELRKHLAGAKSARRFFALVGTAPVKGKLLLSGKNVPSEAVADAKKAFQASTCQR